MQRGKVYNNKIGYFLELYIFISSFSGIEGDLEAHFLDEDTETKSDSVACRRWGSDAIKGRATVTIAGLGACRPHSRSVYWGRLWQR